MVINQRLAEFIWLITSETSGGSSAWPDRQMCLNSSQRRLKSSVLHRKTFRKLLIQRTSEDITIDTALYITHYHIFNTLAANFISKYDALRSFHCRFESLLHQISHQLITSDSKENRNSLSRHTSALWAEFKFWPKASLSDHLRVTLNNQSSYEPDGGMEMIDRVDWSSRRWKECNRLKHINWKSEIEKKTQWHVSQMYHN